MMLGFLLMVYLRSQQECQNFILTGENEIFRTP